MNLREAKLKVELNQTMPKHRKGRQDNVPASGLPETFRIEVEKIISDFLRSDQPFVRHMWVTRMYF